MLSSPYLLVFGDDHVMRYTEQMMLEVVLMKHRFRKGLAWGKTFMMFSCFMDFKRFVIIYLTRLDFCNRQS